MLESQLAAEQLPQSAWKVKARSQLALEQPQRAIETLQRALDLATTADAELLRLLAQASVAAGDAAQAGWAIAEARRLDPQAASSELEQLESQIASMRLASSATSATQ
jgi:Flp pilus assembly protein TadD